MKFEEALSAMREGKRVRLGSVEFELVNGRVSSVNRPDLRGSWAMNTAWITRTDWEVVPPPAPKLYPFSVALEMARGDEKVRIRRLSAGSGSELLRVDTGRQCLVLAEPPYTNAMPDAYGVMARDWVIETP